MEIVKNNFNPVRSKKMKCKHCKFMLRVTDDDLKMQYNENNPASYYFECPCCKGYLEVYLKKEKKVKKHR